MENNESVIKNNKKKTIINGLIIIVILVVFSVLFVEIKIIKSKNNMKNETTVEHKAEVIEPVIKNETVVENKTITDKYSNLVKVDGNTLIDHDIKTSKSIDFEKAYNKVVQDTYGLRKEVVSEKKTNQIDMYLFYGETCRYSQALIKFLDSYLKEDKDIVLHKYEVWNNEENNKLFGNVMSILNDKRNSVPYLVIGTGAIVGYDSGETDDKVKEKVKYFREHDYVDEVGIYLGIKDKNHHISTKNVNILNYVGRVNNLNKYYYINYDVYNYYLPIDIYNKNVDQIVSDKTEKNNCNNDECVMNITKGFKAISKYLDGKNYYYYIYDGDIFLSPYNVINEEFKLESYIPNEWLKLGNYKSINDMIKDSVIYIDYNHSNEDKLVIYDNGKELIISYKGKRKIVLDTEKYKNEINNFYK